MKTLIKEKNKYAIDDFCVGRHQRMQGTKLKALYRLIQKKGEIIDRGETSEGINLKGRKALQYSEGVYIAMIHTPIKKGSFYPCKLQTVQLTSL